MFTLLPGRASAPVRFASVRFSAFTLFHGLLICSIFLASAARAQTAHFAGAQTTIAGSLSLPYGVAVDGNGNVYIANSGPGQLLKETLSNGIYTQSTIVSGLADPVGVAVDGNGNLYIANTSGGQLLKETLSDGIYTQSTIASGLSSPEGVTVDSSGNVYIVNFSGGGQLFKETLSDGVYTQSTIISGLNSPMGVAVDGSGNIYVVNSGTDQVLKEAPSGSSYTQSVVADSGSGLDEPYGVAVDGSGNVYISDFSKTQILEEVLSGGGYVQTTVGSGLDTPYGVAVDGSGNVYVADTGNSRVVKDAIAGINFNSSNIGTATANIPLTFTFDTAGTLGALPEVLTGGAAVKDFTDDTTGTCTTNGANYSYNPGDTCTVNVAFTPEFAGTRQGAVVLDDANGNTMATAYLYGSGAGPQIAFSPAAQSAIGSGLNDPAGVAVDGSGNVYIADATNNRVLKETLSGGSYAQAVIGSGFITPAAIAVDGSGNLYIANTGADQVLKETLSAGVYVQTTILSTGLHIPEGIAVDGSGNVYIADTFNNRILKETLSGGIYQEATILDTGLSGPDGVAVDGNGNLYIADTNNNRVLKETLSQGSYVQSTILGAGLNLPEDVAVDGSGNVYIADSNNNHVLEITSAGLQTTIGSGLNSPGSVAIDGSGNVYIADYYNNRVLAENVLTPAALSFASTVVGATSSDSPQAITVINNGTAGLSFTALAGMNPSITAGFVYDNSSTCPQLDGMSGSSTMAPGSLCTDVVSFTPVAVGSISGSLVTADNNLNSPNATQTIALSGTATQGTTTTMLTSSAGAITAGQNVTFTATVSSATGTPTGTVTFFNGNTSIGTGTLNGNGVATFSTTTLAPGADPSFTASYAGNTSFSGSTSAAVLVEVSVPVTPPSYTVNSTSPTLSVKQGQTVKTTLTLTPAGGYNGTVTFSCQGLPANAACVFSPASANLTGKNQPVSVGLTIDTNVQQARIGAATRPGQDPPSPALPALAFWFPGSIAGLAGLRRKRKLAKAGQRWLHICLLTVASGALAVGLSGCGAVSHQTPAGSSSVTVLATGTSSGAVTTKSVLLTVTITS